MKNAGAREFSKTLLQNLWNNWNFFSTLPVNIDWAMALTCWMLKSKFFWNQCIKTWVNAPVINEAV